MSKNAVETADVKIADPIAKEKISPLKILWNGIMDENPVFRLLLGTCPLLAITTSAKNAISMGLAVIFVQAGSEVIISLLRKFIPDKVRIPAFITIIAGFVTIVQMLVSAYLPALNESLGIYIPLIVVNCIVLARAEAYASKKSVGASFFDGIGMGVGFTVALFIMASIREILGNGTFFDIQLPLFGTVIEPMLFFILPPGGFFVFGICIVISQALLRRLTPKKNKNDLTPDATAAEGGCSSCGSCPGCPGTSTDKGGNA
jgi:Na+-translocating ferredoxin:NAD+ oxidoreductase subunit E